MAAVVCLSGVRLMNTENWLIAKVISGGQTGADRAALDWACENGVPHGGWCPKGRMAADGPLAPHYQLCETDSAGYRQRTKLNVRDSDATLVLNTGTLDGGTLQTVRFGVLSRNRRKFRQPINVACPAPGRWGRPNSRVTSRHFDHGNASRTSRPDCSGLDEAD